MSENNPLLENETPNEAIEEAIEQPETQETAGPQEEPSVTDEAPAEEVPAEEAQEVLPEDKSIPYHERYYLRYRDGKRVLHLI